MACSGVWPVRWRLSSPHPHSRPLLSLTTNLSAPACHHIFARTILLSSFQLSIIRARHDACLPLPLYVVRSPPCDNGSNQIMTPLSPPRHRRRPWTRTTTTTASACARPTPSPWPHACGRLVRRSARAHQSRRPSGRGAEEHHPTPSIAFFLARKPEPEALVCPCTDG